MGIAIQLIICAFVSLLTMRWIYSRVLKIAIVKGFMDNPNERKLQKVPVPVLGGIAVVFGFVTGMLTFVALQGISPSPVIHDITPILLGSILMLYIGTMDDILGLSSSLRLVIEVVVMLGVIYGSGICIDSFHGLWGIQSFSWRVAVPLTVFAGVGLINAYNMVDGVNGLSSGLYIASSCLLIGISWKCEDYVGCAIALCFACSMLPFFMHNVFGRKSRMFIGDGGSMVMGLLVTWSVMRVLSCNNAYEMIGRNFHGCRLGLVALMLSVASVPVFDTVRVMFSRILRGESPCKADKTHLHHKLVGIGLSHPATAMCEILLNLLVVGIWYLSYRLGLSVNVQFNIVMVSSILLIWGTYFTLSKISERIPEIRERKWVKNTHVERKKWWLTLEQWLDRGVD